MAGSDARQALEMVEKALKINHSMSHILRLKSDALLALGLGKEAADARKRADELKNKGH